MSVEMNCPDRLTIDRMRHDHLPMPEPFLKHLEECPQCAETMTELSANDTWAEQVRSGIKAYQNTDSHAADRLVHEILTLSLPAARTSDEVDLSTILAPPLAEGELGRLGDYRVRELIGQGGMGLVFLADDPRLQRRVALKVMRPEKAKVRGMKDRFLREARAVAAFECEFIVPIYDVNEANGVPYIVMPYLKGELLADRLRSASGPLPLADVISIGQQIASGLATAHAKGLVHRDIKPSNIWLDQHGTNRVKILDFGLARGPDEPALTQVGDLIGTPSFMAPEQARGEPVDHRADLFSLGVILYVMSTGVMPFRGQTTFAILTSLAVDTPQPVRTVNVDIPPRLATLIDRLISKDCDHRPATADEVVREFNEWDASPIEPAVTVQQPQRSSGRRLLTMAAVLLGAIGVFAAGTFVFQSKDGKLIVEVDDSVDLRMKNGALELYNGGNERVYTLELSQKSAAIAPGKYLVKVVGADGLRLETSNFEMTKAGKVVLRVTAESNAVDAKPTNVSLDSSIAAEKLPFGKVDAFPGKVTFRDEFDNAAKCLLPLSDLPPFTREIRDGKYLITHEEPIKSDFLFVNVLSASATGAFVARVRVDNGMPYINVRSRVNDKQSRFLQLNIYADGRWAVHMRRQERQKDNTFAHIAASLLHSSKEPDPNLTGGKWVIIASRWSDSDYAFWINGTQVASGTIDLADQIGGQTGRTQIGLQVNNKQLTRFEMDFATQWDQADVPPDKRSPRLLLP